MPTDKTISNRSPRARFYLSTDHDPGYWQIFLELTSCGKLASLHQQLFKTPMFLKLLLTAYYCMPDTLLAYFECTFEILLPPVQNLPSCTNIYSGHLCFKSYCWQNTIVCKRPDTLLAYLECAFEMLLQYQAHVKLKKCKFLHPILECVGVELTSNGNKPTRSKLPAFFKKKYSHQKLGQTYAFSLACLISSRSYYILVQTSDWTTPPSYSKDFWLPDYQHFSNKQKELLFDLLLARSNHNRRNMWKLPGPNQPWVQSSCKPNPTKTPCCWKI